MSAVRAAPAASSSAFCGARSARSLKPLATPARRASASARRPAARVQALFGGNKS
jgi:hypothetical protein